MPASSCRPELNYHHLKPERAKTSCRRLVECPVPTHCGHWARVNNTTMSIKRLAFIMFAIPLLGGLTFAGLSGAIFWLLAEPLSLNQLILAAATYAVVWFGASLVWAMQQQKQR